MNSKKKVLAVSEPIRKFSLVEYNQQDRKNLSINSKSLVRRETGQERTA